MWKLLLVVMVVLKVAASMSQTGHLVVTLNDSEGRPITDATVFVKTLNRTGIMAGTYERDYTRLSASTDSNGVADVSFQFLTSHFEWWLDTPSHHSRLFGCQKAYFGAVVTPGDYEDFDTNTVDGVRMFNELRMLDEQGDHVAYLQKFEPKSVNYTNTVVTRRASFYPKRRPCSLFAYGRMDSLKLPRTMIEYVSNGVMVVRCPTVAVDLEKCELLPPFNNRTPAGVHADFQFERYYVETNGVGNYYGRIVFPPGCGAYKGIKTGNVSFPSTYEADTNAVFLSEVGFSSVHDLATGRGLSVRHLLETNEYMVLRTRLSVSDNGVTNGWHYSKILGPIYVSGVWSFEELVFNPRLNDPNLEFDHNANLARSRGGQLSP